ncbi:MAG: hypothetical protein LBL26_03060 [Peptococcaceae bacterium]|nr:hypothetical protein [Peptococcaceae bacterium]
MMVFVSIPAFAAGPNAVTLTWDGSTTADPRTGPIGANGTQTAPWIIDSPEKLAGLAALVNDGTYSPGGGSYPAAGEIFVIASYTSSDAYPDYNPYDTAQLGQLVFDLAGYAWTPIGGAGPERDGIPYAPYFGGVLDGNNNAIINLNVVPVAGDQTAHASGYGLFGFVNGGAVANLVLGSDSDESQVNLGTTAPYTNVGAVAGYLYGQVINVVSYVETVFAANNDSSNVGGIVGGLDWNGTAIDPELKVLKYSTVRYTVNHADVTGGSRVGGIVGGVYLSLPSGIAQNDQVLVKQSGNHGTVASVRTSQRTYVGGVVGYNEGHILGSYNQGAINSRGGNYIAGAAGILTDYNAPPTGVGSIERTYTSNTVFPDVSIVPEQKPLFASADNSARPTLTRTFWLDTGVRQDIGTPGWGTGVDINLQLTVPQMQGTNPIPGTSDDIAAYMGVDPVTNLNYFTLVANDFPTFGWLGAAPFVLRTYDNGSPMELPSSTDISTAVFLDGRLGSGGSGTQADPFGDWASAAAAVGSAVTPTIYIMGAVEVSSSASFTLTGADVKRSDTWTGSLFEVVTGGNAVFGNITIDGNKSNMGNYICEALIDVQGNGVVSLNSGTLLQNNRAGAGAGIRLLERAYVTMSGTAIIADNEVVNYGGAAGVFGYSTFIMSGGLIEDNLAGVRGDAVDVSDNGTFYWYGGVINSNASSASRIAVTVNDPGAIFEINPAQSTATSAITGIIYLVDNADIKVASTVASLPLVIECEAPDFDVVVARAVNYTFVQGDVSAFSYFDGSYDFDTDGATIYLN